MQIAPTTTIVGVAEPEVEKFSFKKKNQTVVSRSDVLFVLLRERGFGSFCCRLKWPRWETLEAEGGQKGEVVAGTGTVESAVLQVAFQLQKELVARRLAQPHRIRRVELDAEAQDQTVDVCPTDQSNASLRRQPLVQWRRLPRRRESPALANQIRHSNWAQLTLDHG